jgi:RNA polymerase sigma factor (TIGR02999 family)
MAATQMRRILVEHARRRAAGKRGGGLTRVSLNELGGTRESSTDLIALDEALSTLASRNGRHSRVAELRLFAGLQTDEIAEALGVSERTVKRDWRVARAWLARELA